MEISIGTTAVQKWDVSVSYCPPSVRATNNHEKLPDYARLVRIPLRCKSGDNSFARTVTTDSCINIRITTTAELPCVWCNLILSILFMMISLHDPRRIVWIFFPAPNKLYAYFIFQFPGNPILKHFSLPGGSYGNARVQIRG